MFLYIIHKVEALGKDKRRKKRSDYAKIGRIKRKMPTKSEKPYAQIPVFTPQRRAKLKKNEKIQKNAKNSGYFISNVI